ncbi:MAG: ABC transporter permease [Bacteroidota bacterium]|jgi:putative ABC transport system permease protein|nr:ABC transporter permease [Bacteroidota bacterium]MEC8702519.1 ABC transporter permease [Bacteroidota bacterium]|tara:strand:- start:434 stop:1693 length:1260 start_codon:yes stop_codon:yes gene_type:complete
MKLFLRLLKESFVFSFNALIANPVRTVLSLLGVTIGIFTIIAVLSTVDSLEKSIKDNLSFLGTDNLRVEKWPWDFNNPSYEWWKFFRRPEPTYREYEFLKDNLVNAEAVEILTSREGVNVKYSNNSSRIDNLNGVVFENQFFGDWEFIAGRFFTENETLTGSNAAIIGYKIMEDLFKTPDFAIGKQLKIKGKSYTIIGVTKEQGESFGAGDSFDRQMFIPFNSFKKIFKVGRKGSNAVLRVKGNGDEDPGLVNLEYELRGLIRAKRGIKPIEDDSFAINRPEYLASFVSTIFATISIAGWVIGSFSILVGGFGIANIMFVSVKERVPIIGLQKSLGAKKYFILMQFLFESSFLSIFGGLFGIFFVFLLTLPDLGTFDLIISLENVILGVTISSVIGILAGLLPALFASNLDPVEAIRSN